MYPRLPMFPLHNACKYGEIETVKSLIKRSNATNINERDDSGDTPLHVACRFDKMEIVEFLVNSGASTSKKNREKYTVLHDACRNGNPEIIKFIIKYTVPLINEKNIDGSTPLHICCFTDDSGVDTLEIIKLLIRCGADYTIRNRRNKTPIDWLHGNTKIKIQKFIEDFICLDVKQPSDN